MAARSRSNRPPYEVMAGRTAPPREAGEDAPAHAQGGPPLSVSPETAGRAESAETRTTAPAISGGGPGEPLLLRVPRGVAVMAICLILLVIIVSYWVGRVQGRHATLAEYGLTSPELELVESPLRTPTGAAPSAAVPPSDARGVPEPKPIAAAALPREDTRQAGLNYLVLALYDRPQAERLVDFLSENGVDAIIVPRDNRQFSVIDLRGFTAEEIRDGAAYRTHRNNLRRLGQTWKRERNGPSDLSDMWPMKAR